MSEKPRLRVQSFEGLAYINYEQLSKNQKVKGQQRQNVNGLTK